MLEVAALDEEFRLLAEFNGTVLAGRETQHGYQFVTWERGYDGTGVMWGHYYLDNYSEAKQDFAVRGGFRSHIDRIDSAFFCFRAKERMRRMFRYFMKDTNLAGLRAGNIA